MNVCQVKERGLNLCIGTLKTGSLPLVSLPLPPAGFPRFHAQNAARAVTCSRFCSRKNSLRNTYFLVSVYIHSET